MARCETASVVWKGRRAVRISNGTIEITALLGGGHIADARLCGSPYNVLFEAPWQTIEPHTFSSPEHAPRFGDGAVGKFLSGYSGHALALGYFGMPSPAEAAAGLPLHGEAASAEWTVLGSAADERRASVSLEVLLPHYKLRANRTVHMSAGASSVLIEEHVTNIGDQTIDFQWVEHATFGEPLFASGEARLFLSAARGKSWPLGYEGHELLPPDVEFTWPHVPAISGEDLDISQPFPRAGTGFLVSLLMHQNRSDGFIAVHNERLEIAAGYVFDARRFPWVAIWEENRARNYAPWNGITRARGVEFGTSPMPLGLDHARQVNSLFDIPVFATIAPGEVQTTAYQLFVTKLPAEWSEISDVAIDKNHLVLCGHHRLKVIPRSTK